jgi:steroid 5-alpha reductase family enzyme
MNLLSIISKSGLWKLIASDNSAAGQLFHTLIATMLIVALVCFVVGELTRNYSQVDKIWSLMPIVYSLITLSSFPFSPRIWLMAILVTIWGLRLSYNFYRKGGYNIIPWKGEEDYRWNLLRQNPLLQKGIRTPLFNLLFILIESLSDNQLFNFQQQKQNKIPANGKFTKSLAKGFMMDGWWKYVRHPNYISEQAIWFSFYFFGVAASGQWVNWTLTGPVLLIFLFAGSSDFTESISMKKYPDYLGYKENVPKFIPFIFKLKQEKNQKQ